MDGTKIIRLELSNSLSIICVRVILSQAAGYCARNLRWAVAARCHVQLQFITLAALCTPTTLRLELYYTLAKSPRPDTEIILVIKTCNNISLTVSNSIATSNIKLESNRIFIKPHHRRCGLAELGSACGLALDSPHNFCLLLR